MATTTKQFLGDHLDYRWENQQLDFFNASQFRKHFDDANLTKEVEMKLLHDAIIFELSMTSSIIIKCAIMKD